MEIYKRRGLQERFKIAFDFEVNDSDLINETDEEGKFVIINKNRIIGKRKTWEDVIKEFKEIRKFTKKDRSSFKYWFAHWCAFQMTALNLKIWHPRFLLHDIEKPWLRLIWNYKRVQHWHRFHNAHHMEYGILKGFDRVDWVALIVDYECSRYTKLEAPLDTRQTIESMLHQNKWKPYEDEIRKYTEPLIAELGL